GDGHRGSKDDAIVAIQTASVTRVPGSTEYALAVATAGDPATGPLAFLLLDPAGDAVVGDARGPRPLSGATVSGGRITAAPGYTLLNLGQISARSQEVTEFTVPTPAGAIRSSGASQAYESIAGRLYRADCDCITESATGHVWR